MRSLARRFSLLAYSPSSPCWAWASWQRAMGGGPRTFPGGVTKWQWKRMMVKKREEREERRLDREKEAYKMRQRAEVLSAHPELQQSWEKLATFPPPGTSAQQHLVGLVTRFHKPSDAEDLWTQMDGPQHNHQNPSLDASADAVQSQPRGARSRRHVAVKVKKTKQVSPIGKSMQDYIDAFETDPLGLAVDIGTSTSSKEKHRDPLGLAVDSKANTKKSGVGKGRVN